MNDDMGMALLDRLMFQLMKLDVPNLDGNKVPTWLIGLTDDPAGHYNGKGTER